MAERVLNRNIHYHQIVLSTFPLAELNLPDWIKKKVFFITPAVTTEEIFDFYSSILPPTGLFSVVTAFYNTTENKIRRCYESLKSQSHGDWEWVMIDDSTDIRTSNLLYSLSTEDSRIHYYRFPHTGNIGLNKRRGFLLSSGEYIVELDHDDALIDTTLANLRLGFSFPEVGFVYTNWSEIYEDGQFKHYGDSWGWGYGGYDREFYKGEEYLVLSAPNINPMTVRSLVSLPNHVRAWRRDVYLSAGGHSENLTIGDDYDLLIKTFLITKFLKIPRLGYLQFFDRQFSNSQYRGNRVLQKNIEFLLRRHDNAIHQRFLELGIEDFLWNEEKSSSDFSLNKWSDVYINLILKI